MLAKRSVVGQKPKYSSKPLLRFDRAALYYADVYIFLSVCKAFWSKEDFSRCQEILELALTEAEIWVHFRPGVTVTICTRKTEAKW